MTPRIYDAPRELRDDSREFTDTVLAELRDGGLRPAAWFHLTARITGRSIEQVIARPWAAVEVTAIHAVSAALAARGGRVGSGPWPVIVSPSP